MCIITRMLNLQQKNDLLRKKIEQQRRENERLASQIDYGQESVQDCQKILQDVKREVSACETRMMRMRQQQIVGAETSEKLLDLLNECERETKTVDRELKRVIKDNNAYLAEWSDWMEAYMERCELNKKLLSECQSDTRELQSQVRDLPTQSLIRNVTNIFLNLVDQQLSQLSQISSLQLPERIKVISAIENDSERLRNMIAENKDILLEDVFRFYLNTLSSKGALLQLTSR